MKIIFDLDHTLFSAKRFYEALKGSFLKLGVNKKLFQQTYRDSKDKSGNYRSRRQLELIIREKPEVSLQELKKSLKKVLSYSKQFLYSDVLSFLTKARKDFDLIIVSYGEERFQLSKIKKSKIAEFFQKIFIVKDITKTSVFKTELRNEGKIIFVDDSPTALSEIKKNFPNIITVRINRGEGKYSKEKGNKNIDFFVRNLKELREIIDNMPLT